MQSYCDGWGWNGKKKGEYWKVQLVQLVERYDLGEEEGGEKKRERRRKRKRRKKRRRRKRRKKRRRRRKRERV